RDRLQALFPGASRTARRGWLASGRVRVDGVVVRRGGTELDPAARVSLGGAVTVFPAALRLVHEDEDLLVIDKPAGLLTVATERERERTAYRLLFEDLPAPAPRPPRPAEPPPFLLPRPHPPTSGLPRFPKAPPVQ